MIATLCRTLNEERNIERFCTEYGKISDVILIADGGSEDRTLSIANRIPKVKWRHFTEVVTKPGGIWRNPHGRHINFMIDWAIEEKADWIIYDDCDSVPNAILKSVCHDWMDFGVPTIKVHRMYIYGSDQYFPGMSRYGASLWAWKPSEVDIRAAEDDPFQHTMVMDEEASSTDLLFPHALLHYSWPNEEEVRRKMKFYADTKEHKVSVHPTRFGGQLAPLPEWAVL